MSAPGGHETREEQLTRQFYEWERRGRGWRVWEHPVNLEPPFRPFIAHCTPSLRTRIDDGRKPGFLTSLFDKLKAPQVDLETTTEEPEPEPHFVSGDSPICELQITLPADTKVSKDPAGQFVLNLGHVSRPMSFEVIGTSNEIVVQVACALGDRDHAREQLQAYFPDAVVSLRNGYLQTLWNHTGDTSTAVVDFGLSKEFMRPLRCFERFDPDPLAGVMGALADLSSGEVALLQVMFAPTRHPWSESVLRSVTDNIGEDFFADDPSMRKLAVEKISRPLFAGIIRVACQSPRSKRAWKVAVGMGKALGQFAEAASNELIPLSNDDYEDAQHAKDVLTRQSCRSGMLLNCDELLSLVHLPSVSARATKLKRDERKTKAPPALALGHALKLGENQHVGKSVPVSMSTEIRVRHMHLVGASGSGKSTLLLNMIVQDIQQGNGIAVLDPHGDLIEQVIGHIPEDRAGDVVLFDPSDENYPVGFNILSAHSDLERNLLASDLVSVFRRLSTSFGDQMITVLGNAILALLESSDGGTLLDLRRFLVEPIFRTRFLETVRDSEVVYYWQKEFPLLAGKPQGPILTRLDTFLRPKVIRHMVAQKENRLDLGAIMNGRKILLAKLSQGLIGEENSYLLGTLLVSKLNQMATSRQNIAAAERKPFFLYIDEFHNFVTPSLAAILSGARKYNLGLVLAHQELHQLSTRDNDVASAVISNPYTRVCFRLGDFDARKLEDGFSFFKAKDLQNLSVGQAVVRMERAEYDFNIQTTQLPAVDPALATARRDLIVAASRERYAARREDVEALLRASHTAPDDQRVPEAKRPAKIRVSVPLPEPRSRADEDLPPATPGRGGEQHKYLQQLIKRWAEGRGYTVTLEKTILDGLGIIDVVLEKRGQAPVACEISVTTSAEHEVENAQKCLVAGFEHVFLVAADKTALNRVRSRAADALSPSQLKKIQFVLPEQVFASVSMLESRVESGQGTSREGTGEESELLTAKEVEELLRIDVKTIYGYVQKGLIPYIKIQSNLRFNKSEVLAWLAEHRSAKPAPGRK